MHTKKTIEDAKLLATQRGGECLSTEYVNVKTKMKWKCKEGHKWDACYNNIQQGKWCPYCKGGSNTLKLITINMCQQLAKQKGGICLSTQYINATTKMKWKCKENHEWDRCYNAVQQGAWCRKCADQDNSKRQILKNGLNIAINLAESNGGRCLSTEYINNRTKMKWECEKGHQWYISYNAIQRGSWCLRCTNRISKPSIDWLNSLPNAEDIQHGDNYGEYRIPKTRYHADGYDHKTNTIYEFHGCYWHGCKKCYPDRDSCKVVGKTLDEVYERTMKKEQKIRDLGYNLISVWECEVFNT